MEKKLQKGKREMPEVNVSRLSRTMTRRTQSRYTNVVVQTAWGYCT